MIENALSSATSVERRGGTHQAAASGTINITDFTSLLVRIDEVTEGEEAWRKTDGPPEEKTAKEPE